VSQTEHTPQRRSETRKPSLGRALKGFAYRHIPSFRRERGGLYALYVAAYSPTYVARMRSLHRAGRHGKPMDNGRCTWCGEAAR
jgi:hypothetical protein